MKKAILILFFLILFFSCEKPMLIDRVTIDYIKDIEKELRRNNGFNIFIEEIEKESKMIYRINSANLNLTKDNLPYDYYKIKTRYVFKFNIKEKISSIVIEDLENKRLFKDSNYYFNLEHNPEWIFILCDNGKHLLVKDSWYRPLEEIEEIKNFKCN